MAGTFTKISQDAFEELQVDAGVLLSTFNPANPSVSDANIITATTGGITVSCVPTYSDWGEDVDNCPNNTKEYKHLDGWECSVSCNALGTSPALIKKALGAADIDGTDTTKIVPRAELRGTDFSDIWWVGDRADGGMVAVKLINALSQGGFSLKTTKNGKGQITLELRGHISVSAQTVVPMEFYSAEGDEQDNPWVLLNKHAVSVEKDGTVTLTAQTNPVSQTIAWSSGSTSIASVSGGIVTGGSTAGNTIITAAITVDGVTYTDTCTVVNTVPA